MIPPELIRRIRRVEIAARRKVTGRFSGGYLSVFRGQGMEFDDVRAYQPGDDVRSIDWNVTARAGKPYIKRFVVEREMTVLLVLDRSASLAFGTTAQSKASMAAELCTLLAFLAVGNNDRVGLVLATDKVEQYLPPGKGKRHLYRLVRTLLNHTPEHPGTDLAEALRFARRMVPRHSTVFVISDFLQPGGSDRLEKALAQLARRHDTIALTISDPAEYQLPQVGLLRAHDPERGDSVLIDTADPQVQSAFTQATEQARSQWVQRFNRNGIDHVPLSTAVSYVDGLLHFFHRRAQRQR